MALQVEPDRRIEVLEQKSQFGAEPLDMFLPEHPDRVAGKQSGQLRTRFQAFVESLEIKRIQQGKEVK